MCRLNVDSRLNLDNDGKGMRTPLLVLITTERPDSKLLDNFTFFHYSVFLPQSGITQSGITYYPPQTQPRPILSQRRPTNAIPILAPSERFTGKGRNRQNNSQFDEDDKAALNAPIGSPENIDHILDNMFTQRPPFQPPTRKSNSPSPESKVGESQNEAAQSNVSFDGGNKQLEFVDGGMAVS